MAVAVRKEKFPCPHAKVSCMHSQSPWPIPCLSNIACKCEKYSEVERYLHTDSLSARQLAMKQEVGKAKHSAGKLLWIQDAVQNKVTNLVQVPTLWTFSDIGTKPLGAKRLRLLLHEMCVATGEGDYAVGAEEFQQQ